MEENIRKLWVTSDTYFITLQKGSSDVGLPGCLMASWLAVRGCRLLLNNDLFCFDFACHVLF